MSAPNHLRFANAPRDIQQQTLVKLALTNPVTAEILRRVPALPLPQGMLVSGCIYQSVWNGLLGHDPQRGILDYDLVYFDDSDLSYEAEDVVIQACAKAFADIDAEIEVRNQARVHLWFEQRFGLDYAPLRNAAEALDRYMSPCNAVAIAPKSQGGSHVIAPFGFDDLFGFIVQPQPDRSGISPESYLKKTTRMKAMWPQITVIPLD